MYYANQFILFTLVIFLLNKHFTNLTKKDIYVEIKAVKDFSPLLFILIRQRCGQLKVLRQLPRLQLRMSCLTLPG